MPGTSHSPNRPERSGAGFPAWAPRHYSLDVCWPTNLAQ